MSATVGIGLGPSAFKFRRAPSSSAPDCLTEKNGQQNKSAHLLRSTRYCNCVGSVTELGCIQWVCREVNFAHNFLKICFRKGL